MFVQDSAQKQESGSGWWTSDAAAAERPCIEQLFSRSPVGSFLFNSLIRLICA